MDLENTFSTRLDGIQAHSDMIRQEIRQKEATVRELSAENDSLNGQIADMEDTLRVSVLMMKVTVRSVISPDKQLRVENLSRKNSRSPVVCQP